jgi:hypothetical protein
MRLQPSRANEMATCLPMPVPGVPIGLWSAWATRTLLPLLGERGFPSGYKRGGSRLVGWVYVLQRPCVDGDGSVGDMYVYAVRRIYVHICRQN